MPSRPCSPAAARSICPSSYVGGTCQAPTLTGTVSRPRSSSTLRRSESGRSHRSSPSSRRTSKTIRVTGFFSERRWARAASRTCIRSARAPKEGTPSPRATTSPSSSTSSAARASPLSSGKETVTSFSLRDQIRSRSGVRSTSTRMPSHLTSWVQSAPDGTRSPLVASIGSTGSVWHLFGRLSGHGGWRNTCDTGHPDHMRAIWKGAVSFGLVSVPVKLSSATESKDISFRQVHAKEGGRIKYQRVCSIDGEEVEYADIAKGYETEDGEMVILTDEDMASLPSESSREISVEKFVPSDQIDPMLFEKSYYLEPEKTGAKPYALLREALEAADRMALVTVSLRNRMSLAVLRVRDDVIVMQTMMWPDEIRKPDFGSVDTSGAKPAEVKMAKMLVETLAGDFDASEFEDDYRGAV